jgi:alpha-mannosidase
MQKHPDITRRRIDSFYADELAPRLISECVPLTVEISAYRGDKASEAERAEWSRIAPGYEYGPAYETFWFRVSGNVPASLGERPVAIVAPVGVERTIWREGVPYCGMDPKHDLFHWPREWGAEHVSLLIQVTARNPQASVRGREAPRAKFVEKVGQAMLVVYDQDLAGLAFDVDFARGLLDTIESGDPSYAALLRALNAMANAYSPDQPESLARCRKIIRDSLRNMPGELGHNLTAVGHAHLDTAWLWPMRVTHLKLAHTAATQLRLMERYPEYVFAHSQASQYEWLEHEHPQLFAQVKDAVVRGQWEPVGSMWVEADCNLAGGESLVRQFLYGRKYFRDKFNYETRDMWLPDVFGYSAALPQILAKFGIEYFLTQKMSWNQTNRFPHNTFWWQGIDGTQVWTHFPPADTYCGSAEPEEIVRAVKNYRDHGRCDASLYLFGFGDGGGGPTERQLEFLRRGRLAPNYPEIPKNRRALDFFRDAKNASRDLSVWAGELYLEYHRGTYTSQAANKKGNRQSEFLLRDAEWLACFTVDFHSRYPAEEIERAWKLVLLNQFHDILPGSSIREVYEDSARDYAEVARIGEDIVRRSLVKVAEHFDTRDMSRPVALFQNAQVATQAEIPWDEDDPPASIMCGGEQAPAQLIEEFGVRKLIFPTPSAAFGSVALADLCEEPVLSLPRLKVGARRLESDRWVVRFDLHGNLTSVQSLEDGTEFLEPGKLGNLLQLFDDKPLSWSAWDIDPFVFESGQDLFRSESFEIVERGPVRAAVEVVKRFGKSTIRQRISVGATPGIRFDTEVDWHEENKLLKAAFPVNVNANRATYEIQFGSVERPTHSNTSWDAARFEVCAHKWVDLSEGGQGVSLLNDGKYGHDIRGNVMRLSLLRAPKAPDPQCDMGLHRFTYVLLPHFFGVPEANIVQHAFALNSPIRHAFMERRAGGKAVLPPLMSCEDVNIVILAVKRAEDGNGIIVRLYECHNCRGKAELSCMRTVAAAALCDLEERDLRDLEISDEGKVRFDYKPFEILTIRLSV